MFLVYNNLTLSKYILDIISFFPQLPAQGHAPGWQLCLSLAGKRGRAFLTSQWGEERGVGGERGGRGGGGGGGGRGNEGQVGLEYA